MSSRSRSLRVALVVLAGALSSACASLSYQPNIVVGSSGEPIPVRVEIRALADATPPGDAKRMLGGTSATAPDSMSGELSAAVTDAILTNLRNDEFFGEIRRRTPNPDLVMTGTIRRFYGKSNINPLGWVTTVLVGIPLFSSYGAVDLELALERPDGKRVAAYTSKIEFSEWSTIFQQPMHGIGTKLNKALSDAVRDIRGQMQRDRVLLASYGVALPASHNAER